MMKCRRKGVSLFEALVAVTLLSFVMTAAVGLIHRAMHEQHRSRTALEVQGSLARLAARFRQDAHASRRATWSAPEASASWQLELVGAGGALVQYDAEQHAVRRTALAPGRPAHHDEFQLPAGHVVRLLRPDAQSLELTVWERPRADHDRERLVSRQWVWVGRDQRFTADATPLSGTTP